MGFRSVKKRLNRENLILEASTVMSSEMMVPELGSSRGGIEEIIDSRDMRDRTQ